MARCITCGTELHPERAPKYNYCLAPDCQEKNARGLTMVAIGMNKAAEELRILDSETLDELASGKFRDQRRVTAGPRTAESGPVAAPATGPRAAEDAQIAPATGPRAAEDAQMAAPATGPRTGPGGGPGARMQGRWAHAPAGRQFPARPARPAQPVRQPWTASQQRLALLYNAQGLRPAEIAGKLGISSHLVTQIILSAKNRAKS